MYIYVSGDKLEMNYKQYKIYSRLYIRERSERNHRPQLKDKQNKAIMIITLIIIANITIIIINMCPISDTNALGGSLFIIV